MTMFQSFGNPDALRNDPAVRLAVFKIIAALGVDLENAAELLARQHGQDATNPFAAEDYARLLLLLAVEFICDVRIDFDDDRSSFAGGVRSPHHIIDQRYAAHELGVSIEGEPAALAVAVGDGS